jgi:uncharacterized protein
MNFRFNQLSTPMNWVALLLLSLLLSFFLNLGHFPAAILLGCMFSAILLSTNGAKIMIPKWYFALAQGIIGCLMARSLQAQALYSLAHDWPIFLGVSLAIFLASIFLGWLFMHRGIFLGSTAIWGLAPGAAAAMVTMAESYGADVRLVAFMQYLRVAIVTTIAAIIAHFFTSIGMMQASISPQWFIADSLNLLSTLLVAIGVSLLAFKLAIPGGSMILPLILATLLQYFGLLVIELPMIVLTAAYSIIGWSIGLRFNSSILRHAWHSLPKVLTAIGALIILSSLIAVGLWQLADYDLFTAYLASSPGGADSIAVIAATTTVNTGFVMSMQLSRFVFVLIFGPIASKFIAKKLS